MRNPPDLPGKRDRGDGLAWVLFLGAPSTGKTTLARRLAEMYDTVWMPEYGREYWQIFQQGRRLSLEQLVEIAEVHRERDVELASRARRFLFVDTDARTTRLFAFDYYGRSHPRLDVLADAADERYDVVFLCEDDIPYDDTPERSGEQHRTTFHGWVRDDLDTRGVDYVRLTGPVDVRLARVQEVLARRFPCSSHSTGGPLRGPEKN